MTTRWWVLTLAGVLLAASVVSVLADNPRWHASSALLMWQHATSGPVEVSTTNPLPTTGTTSVTATGQATMAQSLSVAIATDQTAVPVSGTVTANIGNTANTTPILTKPHDGSAALFKTAAALADGTSNPTTGGIQTFNMCYNGSTWDRCNPGVTDPCEGNTKTTTAINQTADAVVITKTSAKKTYICAIALVVQAAEVVSLIEGDGTTCGSNRAALIGSTTDSEGLSFAANGGLTFGNGGKSVVSGKSVNLDICLNQSGTNRVSGTIEWVQQ